MANFAPCPAKASPLWLKFSRIILYFLLPESTWESTDNLSNLTYAKPLTYREGKEKRKRRRGEKESPKRGDGGEYFYKPRCRVKLNVGGERRGWYPNSLYSIPKFSWQLPNTTGQFPVPHSFLFLQAYNLLINVISFSSLSPNFHYNIHEGRKRK